MNTTFKRSVAAFLTAGMLLTGLTACFKSPEETIEDALIEEVSKDGATDFEKILYIHCRSYEGKHFVRLLAYDNAKDAKYYKLEYRVSKEDYTQITNLLTDNEQLYPFSPELVENISYIAKNYDPEVEKNPKLKEDTVEVFDQLVEEYCK